MNTDSVEVEMLDKKEKLLAMGLGAEIQLWCHWIQNSTSEQGTFSWTLFCWYAGQKHQVSAYGWNALLKKVQDITKLDLATREILLSL